jgi:hypothetical protein
MNDFTPFQVGRIKMSLYTKIIMDNDSIREAVDYIHELNADNIRRPPLFYDMGKWDTSRVTDMSYLFSYFITYEECLDISEWDVSNVTNMSHMFEGVSTGRTDLSKWDVSNVECMDYMFAESDFDVDISRWNFGRVKTWKKMFENSSFEFDDEEEESVEKCLGINPDLYRIYSHH